MAGVEYKLYPRLRDSGVEWLGDVPENWKVLPLKRIVLARITDGPHETPTFLDEGIPFVSAEAVGSGEIDFSKIRGYISEDVHRQYSRKYRPRYGDIYIVKSGATTGTVAIVETDMEFNIWSPLAAVRCNEIAFPKYVFYCLKSRNFQDAIALNWSYGTQQNIGMGVLENIRVPLPPVATQKTIAYLLDRETARIDALIEKKQRLIELLKEKRQAVITQAVMMGLDPNVPMKDSGVEWLGKVPEHWEQRRLKSLYRQEKRQNHPGLQVLSVYRDHGVVLKDSRDDNANKTPLDLSAYQKVSPGDLVINKMKAWQGSLGVSEHIGITSPDYVVYVPTHKEVSRFLHFLLREKTMAEVYRSNSNGIRPQQWRLEPDRFENIRIYLPPSDEQTAIVDYIERGLSKMENLSLQVARGIELLQERRASLITAAVTGQIDVRNAT